MARGTCQPLSVSNVPGAGDGRTPHVQSAGVHPSRAQKCDTLRRLTELAIPSRFRTFLRPETAALRARDPAAGVRPSRAQEGDIVGRAGTCLLLSVFERSCGRDGRTPSNPQECARPGRSNVIPSGGPELANRSRFRTSLRPGRPHSGLARRPHSKSSAAADFCFVTSRSNTRT